MCINNLSKINRNDNETDILRKNLVWLQIFMQAKFSTFDSSHSITNPRPSVTPTLPPPFPLQPPTTIPLALPLHRLLILRLLHRRLLYPTFMSSQLYSWRFALQGQQTSPSIKNKPRAKTVWNCSNGGERAAPASRVECRDLSVQIRGFIRRTFHTFLLHPPSLRPLSLCHVKTPTTWILYFNLRHFLPSLKLGWRILTMFH